MFIYKIENKVNGKIYIGETTRSEVGIRWDEHISALKNNRHSNNHLQNAWNKYGYLNFDFSVISEFPENFEFDELLDIERRTISLYDSYRNGYNLTPGGDGVRRLPEEFEYSVAKMGFTSNGKQQYVILDRNTSPLIHSIDKAYLESFLPLLNSDETAGLKAIKEAKIFKYSVAKKGFTSNGKQRYVIYDRNNSPLIYSIDKTYLESFLPLLNSDETAGLKAIKEDDRFKYTVAKMGFTSNGKQQYVILDRNTSPLIISIDKTYLESFLPLLNSDETAGLKAIKEDDRFKYTVAKMGFNSNGKQQYVIYDRNTSPLIISIDKTYLEFVVELLNENEEDLIIEKNDKFKLKNKKGLKTLYKQSF